MEQRWRARFFTIWSGQSLSLVAMAPSILLRPLIGVLVDRSSRRRVMILSGSLIALVSLWLAYLFWSGTMEIWHVYVVMLARSFGRAFHHRAMSASVTLLVPKRHYAQVEGLNQIIDGGLGIVGPLLGAVLIALLPLHGIMMLDFATAAFAVLPLFLFPIRQPEPIVGEASTECRFWAEFRAGLRYVLAWRGLIALCGLLIVMNFALSPAFSLTPILVLNVFSGEAAMLGWFNSALGLGTVLGGLLLSAWGGFRRKIVTPR